MSVLFWSCSELIAKHLHTLRHTTVCFGPLCVCTSDHVREWATGYSRGGSRLAAQSGGFFMFSFLN